MATHSRMLAWTEEPGGLQSMGSQNNRTQLSNETTTNSCKRASIASYLQWRPGMGGELSEKGPLCVLFSLHGPVNVYQTLAVPSPGELPSLALKSQSPTPNTLFVFSWRYYLKGEGFGHLGELLNFYGSTLRICCCCCQVTSVVSDSVRPHRRQSTRLPRPWNSPGKNTRVGCHFLLQCMRVKSENEVAQSCPTQRPHGLQPSRLLHPWDSPGKSTGVDCHCLLWPYIYMWLKVWFSPVHKNKQKQGPTI